VICISGAALIIRITTATTKTAKTPTATSFITVKIIIIFLVPTTATIQAPIVQQVFNAIMNITVCALATTQATASTCKAKAHHTY